jgi:hypothetical protein
LAPTAMLTSPSLMAFWIQSTFQALQVQVSHPGHPTSAGNIDFQF